MTVDDYSDFLEIDPLGMETTSKIFNKPSDNCEQHCILFEMPFDGGLWFQRIEFQKFSDTRCFAHHNSTGITRSALEKKQGNIFKEKC